MAHGSRVSAVRRLGVTVACAAFVGGLFALARTFAHGAEPVATFASALLGAFAMLLAGSLAEWWVHGGLMHRASRLPLLREIYALHHRAHHWKHFRPDAFHQERVTYVPVLPLEPDRSCRTRSEEVRSVAAQACFYGLFVGPPALVALPLTGNAVFAGSMGAVSLALVALAIHLHDSVHCPGHSVLERFAWFRWLDRHHYFHHVDTDVNVNLVLPLGDLLMGTLRLELSPAELGRFEPYELACASVRAPEPAYQLPPS
jgi:hypothetical protein